MILLTPEIRARLAANGREPDRDHAPVLKLFNPIGEGVWLATMIETDGDLLYGVADLGFGCPEAGHFSLREIEALRLPLGLGIERDILFETAIPLSIWIDIVGEAGSLRAAERIVARLERGAQP